MIEEDRNRLFERFRLSGYQKVMIVTTRFGPYPPDVTILRGGIDTNTQNLIDILGGNGFDVTVAALDYVRKSGVDDRPEVRRIGTYRPYAFEKSPHRKLLRLLNAETLNPVVLTRLLVLLRTQRPDAIILQESLQLGLAPHIAARILRVPLYFRNDWICPARPEDIACGFKKRVFECSVCLAAKMGQRLGKLEGYGLGLFSALIYLLKSWFWRTGAGAIPSSEYVADLLVGYGVPRSRILVVRPCREIEIYTVSDEPFVRLQYDGVPKLLFVGRLEKDKGIDVLLDSFKQALAGGTCAELLIAGEGTLRPLVEESASECARVVYLGWLDEDGLSQAYQVCDAVIMPTIVIESHGIVAEEAISYGKILAGSNKGGLARIMAEYPKSIAIDEVNVDSLARVIIELAERSGT